MAGPSTDPAERVVDAMNSAMIHRGPDDSGISAWGDTAIGMRRLSIIDLAGGHQPIDSSDGRYSIVFNGEIYNFRELRAELQREGHEFRTRSDTEVVLQLFQRDGSAAPARLNGMFAFCVLDREDGSLFLARDEFGQKPLYYAARGSHFAFSSELPSLLEDRSIERRLDHEALAYYLRVWTVPAPLTIISGVRQLLPGHWMRWHEGEITTGCSSWSDPRAGEPITTDAAAIEAVRTTLQAAVERHMIADVDLGVFLSGGIDSAAIAAAAARTSDSPVTTFTVRWEDPDFDESRVAATVARHLGTDHHELVIGDGGFDPVAFAMVVDHMSQPLADTSLLPTYLLCRETRRHVKVALSGDGGDEIFGGYPDVIRHPTVDRLGRALPAPLLRGGARAVAGIARRPRAQGISALRTARRLLEAAATPLPDRLWVMNTSMTSGELAELAGDRVPEPDMVPVKDLIASAERGSMHWTPLRQMLAYRTSFILPDQLLIKSDRMSMAASLEVRAPLLDREIAALSRRLDDRMLVRGGIGKWVLREAIRPWVPAVVFDQPKRGFDAPLKSLRNQAFEDLCHDLVLGADAPPVMGLFDHAALEHRVERVLAGHTDSATESEYRANGQVWALLVLAAWCRRFGVTP